MLWEGSGPCPACREAPPPQRHTVVWGEHDGLLRSAVLMAKHGGRDELSGPLAGRLASAVSAEGVDREADLVCEVPSHPLTGLFRGVVLARELASGVARRLGLQRARVLRRRGLTRQAGRSRAARRGLPANAFRAGAGVRGRHVLLVDDVMTTGTTLRRAAAALLRSGARSVRCAVLAAAPDPRRLP